MAKLILIGSSAFFSFFCMKLERYKIRKVKSPIFKKEIHTVLEIFGILEKSDPCTCAFLLVYESTNIRLAFWKILCLGKVFSWVMVQETLNQSDCRFLWDKLWYEVDWVISNGCHKVCMGLPKVIPNNGSAPS